MGGAAVTLNSADGNEPAPIVWSGGQAYIRHFKTRLDGAYGAFGHFLDLNVTTPIDLHYAVFTKLADFKPRVTAGAEMVKVYDPGIPAGAVT